MQHARIGFAAALAALTLACGSATAAEGAFCGGIAGGSAGRASIARIGRGSAPPW